MESMEIEDPMEKFLENSRFWIQRVFVPILVFIGVVGNIVTVMVLTRRRMRCTTTIYLTALALADVIYLLFVLLLSFEHYPNIHAKKYELYWRFYGIHHWICDAASSTSVWLTVSFTIERYIVVCHPIKGKVLCTENRAKSIIAAISILCLISTGSTSFEYQLNLKEHCVDKVCKDMKNTSTTMSLPDARILNASANIIEAGESSNLCILPKVEAQKPENNCDMNVLCQSGELYEDSNRTEDCCVKSYTIDTEPTNLGKNKTYLAIFYWFSSIVFGLLPLVLIATFNCFLVDAVYKSQKKRKLMTNLQENVTQYQENRITLLLISVVVLFLLCQTPTASFLIYDALDETEDMHTRNIKKACGNIFNFLITINAACNFILYCVLSDRYRRTFKTLFCQRKLNRQDTLFISRSRITHRSLKNGFKRNASAYHTPRNLEAHSLSSIPRSKSLMVRPIGKAKSADLNV